METRPTNTTRSTGPRTPRGVSLIEMVIVLTIVSAVGAIVVPRYANAVSNYHCDAAARRIADDINQAREHAIASSKKVTVEFKITSLCMKVHGMPAPDNPANTYEVLLAKAPYNATSLAANFAGKTRVTFNGFGEADAAGSVTIAAGSAARTIVLQTTTDQAVVQ